MEKKILSASTAAALVMGLSAGVVAPATAAQSTSAALSQPVPSSSRHIDVIRTTSPLPASSIGELRVDGPISQGPTSQTNAIWIRLAVKAAMQVIKRTSLSTYRAITSNVSKGKTAFVSWYSKYAPGWVKTLMPAVAASAIYDALRWVIGI